MATTKLAAQQEDGDKLKITFKEKDKDEDGKDIPPTTVYATQSEDSHISFSTELPKTMTNDDRSVNAATKRALNRVAETIAATRTNQATFQGIMTKSDTPKEVKDFFHKALTDRGITNITGYTPSATQAEIANTTPTPEL